MRTKLDQLLADLDPQQTIEWIFRGADRALNTFPMPNGCIEAWPDFAASMGRFRRHVFNHIVGTKGDEAGSVEFNWGFAAQILRKEYGANGDKTAFDLARTGNEGGLYGVFRKVANRMAAETATNLIAVLVGRWWNQLTVEERCQVADEYLARVGHLLPSEITEDGAMRVRVNILGFLKEHPWLVLRHRRVGR